MSTDFKLPELGKNIETIQVTRVLVKSGDAVAAKQPLLEVETDKATIEVPGDTAGTIESVLVSDGDEVSVGQVMLTVTPGDAPAAAPAPAAEPALESAPASPTPHNVPAAPSLRRLAREIGIDVTQVSGTGPTGRVSTDDVMETDVSSRRVVVIGAGPGGYPAAFHAADLGMQVTLVDSEPNPGGVCLYRGCIPSKTLLHAAAVINEAKAAADWGITLSDPQIDLDKLRARKDAVIAKLTGGLGQLSKQRKITYLQGRGMFKDGKTLTVTDADGATREVAFDAAIVATGSQPIHLPFAPPSDRILDSSTALELADIPDSLLLVGGGYIGLELGQLYASLGSRVTVVEMMPTLLPGADAALVRVLSARLRKQFRNIRLETRVAAVEDGPDGVQVTFEGKHEATETFDKVLVAVGRRPDTSGLGLENTGVTLDDKGFVAVDAQRRTAEPTLYAVGDVAGQPMLAHKATYEGKVAAEAIAGKKTIYDPKAIPGVVFTDPEIAWCGMTEAEAREAGRNVKVASFPWGASGRATTLGRSDGVTRLIVDPADHNRLLGVGMAGPGAGELIAEGTLAIEMGAVADDLAWTIHPHPTLSETVMEAAESAGGHAIHYAR